MATLDNAGFDPGSYVANRLINFLIDNWGPNYTDEQYREFAAKIYQQMGDQLAQGADASGVIFGDIGGAEGAGVALEDNLDPAYREALITDFLQKGGQFEDLLPNNYLGQLENEIQVQTQLNDALNSGNILQRDRDTLLDQIMGDGRATANELDYLSGKLNELGPIRNPSGFAPTTGGSAPTSNNPMQNIIDAVNSGDADAVEQAILGTNTNGGTYEDALGSDLFSQVRDVLIGANRPVFGVWDGIGGGSTNTNTGGGNTGNTGGGNVPSIITGPDGQQYIIREDGTVIDEATGQEVGQSNDSNFWGSIFNPPGGGFGNDNGQFDPVDLIQGPLDLIATLFGGGGQQQPGSNTNANANTNVSQGGNASVGDTTQTNNFEGLLSGLFDGSGLGQTIINAGFNELQSDFLKDANKEALDFARESIGRSEPFRQFGINNIQNMQREAQSNPDFLATMNSLINIDPTSSASLTRDGLGLPQAGNRPTGVANTSLPDIAAGTRDVAAPDAIRTDVNANTPFDYQNDRGYQFFRDEGMRLIENSKAAKGKLVSGETLTELQDRGTGLAATYAPLIENIYRNRDATQLAADNQFFGQQLGSNQFSNLLNQQDFQNTSQQRGQMFDESLNRASFYDTQNRADQYDAQSLRDQLFGERQGVAQFNLGRDVANISNQMGLENQRFNERLAENNFRLLRDQNRYNQFAGIVGLGQNAAANQGNQGISAFPNYGETLGQNAALRAQGTGNLFQNLFGGLF